MVYLTSFRQSMTDDYSATVMEVYLVLYLNTNLRKMCLHLMPLSTPEKNNVHFTTFMPAIIISHFKNCDFI